jgi:3-isopropylmalate dehydrogenase
VGSTEVPPGALERGLLLRLRFELDLYINMRPFNGVPGSLAPDCDFVVIRENTEGTYAGEGGFLRRGTPYEVATQGSVNTRHGVERCARFAFALASGRPRRRLTLVHKTNVLTFAGDLWQRTVDDVSGDYPNVGRDYNHVDATCIYLVEDASRYDVIVTDNLFGDIITDLGAAIQGGMGIACGGNINPEGVSMFEPIGGSAPKYTGKNQINPLAAILAGAMMLETLGEPIAAKSIERAVERALKSDVKSLDAGKMGMGTRELGDLIVSYVG